MIKKNMAYWVAVLTSCTSFFSKKSLTFLQSRSRNSSPWGWLGSTAWLTSMYLEKTVFLHVIVYKYFSQFLCCQFEHAVINYNLEKLKYIFIQYACESHHTAYFESQPFKNKSAYQHSLSCHKILYSDRSACTWK